MGKVYMVECKKCGYRKRLFAGGGRMDCMPQIFMKELPEAERKEFEHALADGASRTSIKRLPCVCSDCGEIYTVPIVAYMLDNERYEISGACPDCCSKKYILAENTVNCPVCEAETEIAESGLWD